ncbi:MAG: Crp/Fnr family transcriptional regulator [bacterium]
MNKKDGLKKSLLFSELSEGDLSEVANITTARRFARGEAIFSEGDPADELFILSSGRIEIFKLSADGKRQILRTVVSGEMFAEAAMFSGKTYPAYADALTECEILCIAKGDLLNLLHTNPQLSLKMLGALSSLLRELTTLIEDLSLREVSARLAKFLLDCSVKADRDFFQLEMKMMELAHKIGTVSETLSRTLRKMRLMGIIDIKGKTINILDKEVLQKIASGMKI